jgi:hypothetical protein
MAQFAGPGCSASCFSPPVHWWEEIPIIYCQDADGCGKSGAFLRGIVVSEKVVRELRDYLSLYKKVIHL